MKIEKAECLRRCKALGIETLSGDMTFSGAFVPVDPDAPPKYRGGELTYEYSCEGIRTADGEFVVPCRSQYCLADCDKCAKDRLNLTLGYKAACVERKKAKEEREARTAREQEQFWQRQSAKMNEVTDNG